MDGGVVSSAACTGERQRCAQRGVHGGAGIRGCALWGAHGVLRLEEHKWRVGDL